MNDIMRGTWNPDAGLAAQQGDDNKVWAEFYMRPMVDGPASKEQGRRIVKDVPHIKIIQPGESRHSIYDQPATDQDVMRFRKKWDAFQAGLKQDDGGSPLDLLFPESPAIVENLKSIQIRTVEALANCNDSAIQNIGMGGRQWVEKAKAYLGQAEKGKGFHELAGRLDQMELKAKEKDDRIAALEAALAEATAANSTAKRGRAA